MMVKSARLTAFSRQHALATRGLAGPTHRPHAFAGSRIIVTGGSARFSLRGLHSVQSAMSDRRFERFRRATMDNKRRVGSRAAFNAFVARWLTRVLADGDAVEAWRHGTKMRAAAFVPGNTKRKGRRGGIIVTRWIKADAIKVNDATGASDG